MTPSVSRSGVAVRGVKIPLWRKRGKHAIGDGHGNGWKGKAREGGNRQHVQRQNVLYTILFARVHHNGGNGKKISQKNY